MKNINRKWRSYSRKLLTRGIYSHYLESLEKEKEAKIILNNIIITKYAEIKRLIKRGNNKR